ncbi:MAG: hypothetical protein JWM71_2177, partial [Solirubrobacteraceae bacterium]|nr:hypothetical protein [Solirubrobacteraceae bacterium]
MRGTAGYRPAVLETAPTEVLPRLRGVLHAYAFFFALAAAIV